MEERYLSLSGAADALDISERTAYRWIKSGKLRAYKPGRDYRIPEAALKEAVEASEVHPKGSAPSPLEPSLFKGLEEERRADWKTDVLERVLGTWERQVREKENPYQSRTVAVAALDIQDAVTFNYKPEWDALPYEEKMERHALAKRIDALVLDAFDHFKEAKKAGAAEVEAIQRRREEIRQRTRELSA